MSNKGSYQRNSRTNLTMVLLALSLLFCNFIYATAYHLSLYKLSSPSTTELHVLALLLSSSVVQKASYNQQKTDGS